MPYSMVYKAWYLSSNCGSQKTKKSKNEEVLQIDKHCKK